MELPRLVAPLLHTTDRAGINGSRTVHPLPCLIRAPLTTCINSTPCRNVGIRQQGLTSRWVKQQSARPQPDDTKVTFLPYMSVRYAFPTSRPSFTRWKWNRQQKYVLCLYRRPELRLSKAEFEQKCGTLISGRSSLDPAGQPEFILVLVLISIPNSRPVQSLCQWTSRLAAPTSQFHSCFECSLPLRLKARP